MKTVMLVDDSKLGLKLLERALKTLLTDSEFLLANSGEQAVEIAGELDRGLDIVMIDYNMPGMNGIECAEAIRKLHPVAHLALCTANTQQALVDRAREHGLAVLHKPTTENSIRVLLDDFEHRPLQASLSMNLSDDQLDALKEVFNMGVGNAARALSELAGQCEVELSVPIVKLMTIREIVDITAGPDELVCGIKQAYHGPFSGTAQLVYSAEESLDLVRLLLGSEAPVERISEMESDALCEIGNIVLNTCIATFANLLSAEFTTGIPTVHTDTCMNVLTCFGAQKPEDPMLYVCMDFRLSTKSLSGYLAFAMDLATLDDLVKCLDRLLAGV